MKPNDHDKQSTIEEIVEEWKQLDFTDHKYEISNYGKVKSFARNSKGELIKGRDSTGYLQLDLRVKGKRKSFFIHRLVAEYFCRKSYANSTIVIHKDGDKKNNHFSNLEWCLPEEQIKVKRKYLPKHLHSKLGGSVSKKSDKKPEDGKDYFMFGDKYHRISDNGSCLFIRVKFGDKWKSLALAEIIMERDDRPKPSNKHKLGYIDWDYKNLDPNNLIWETQADKTERLYDVRPLQKERVRQMGLSHTKDIHPKKKQKIDEYLSKGKTVSFISRVLNMPYSRVRKYVLAQKETEQS
ncbi:NUMOD4 domain-containing protein [Sediminitomix flava]|uniref:HNH endonuclease n=1 Tax=Sediminitomix flava TaxID=379075 RepID=A0A315ZDG6_SEDFL|nr:NUMOD4 domain-containing protein [Sediminitomix flava]PWJ43665.1 HNH endonuclease [Sediminitomix flava]